METKEEKTYAELWEATQPPKIAGHYIFGSRGLTKMIVFLQSNPMTIKEINEVLGMRNITEQTGVDKKYNRLFGYFQRDLLKYRGKAYRLPETVKLIKTNKKK